MSKNKIETGECPNCGSEINIYKGWFTFEAKRIISVNADWRCPECEEPGKIGV